MITRKLRHALLAVCLAGAAAPAVAFEGAASSKPDLVSDGTRISLKGGDFTIQPPKTWEVFNNLQGLTLMMQIPFSEGMKFQRSIQVLSFDGPRYIDETTAKEFEELIVRKFSQTSASIEGFRVRNHMNIELADGREGLLFYTEYTQEGVSLMQAHILVASSTRHFLLSYTDVAEHFENDAASQFLTEAWDSMISVELSTRTPARFATAAYLAVGAVAFVILGLVILALRRWRSGRQYKDYANGKGLEDVSLAEEPLTGVEVRFQSQDPKRLKDSSAVSELEPRKGGPRSRPRSTNIPPASKTQHPSQQVSQQAEGDDEDPFDIDDDVAV